MLRFSQIGAIPSCKIAPRECVAAVVTSGFSDDQRSVKVTNTLGKVEQNVSASTLKNCLDYVVLFRVDLAYSAK